MLSVAGACVRVNNCVDCPAGKGPETIFAGQNLNDNEWHTVRVFRRGKSLKLTVDDLPPVEGTLTQRHFSPSECNIFHRHKLVKRTTAVEKLSTKVNKSTQVLSNE